MNEKTREQQRFTILEVAPVWHGLTECQEHNR